MATLIKADGTNSTVTPADGKKFSLDELRKFVGGPVAVVNVWYGENSRMAINEDGIPANLPVNHEATHLRDLSIANNPIYLDASGTQRVNWPTTTPIVGDVLHISDTE